MKKVRQFLTAVVLFTFSVSFAMPSFVYADMPLGKRLFLVTAYYSPLPDQTFYVKGNYEADKILNGNGTNGADGTEVYVGMLAAPKIYAFGTKIQLPGLGIGTVHDRGGAILSHKDYDRIDVWMGKGDAGLARALAWGKRLVEGEILDSTTSEQINLDSISDTLPTYVLNRHEISSTSLSSPQLNTSGIRELQEGLLQFGYYRGEVTGVMDDTTTQAILAFQLDNDVIQSPLEQGAGNFGPKTNAKFKDRLEHFNADIEAERQYLKDHSSDLEPGLGKSDQGDSVAHLQEILQILGYYHRPVSGVYDAETIDSVFTFQARNKVLDSPSDSGAGYFGKATHKALIAAIVTRTVKLQNLPMEKLLRLPDEGTPWPSMSLFKQNDVADAKPVALNFDLWNKDTLSSFASIK